MGSGIIIKGVGSFYYVLDEKKNELVCCRMKGIFRQKGLIPTIGDRVRYEKGEAHDAVVCEIFPRKSLIRRPYIANAEIGVVLVSAKSPDISYILIDKMLAQFALFGLPSLLIINKSDLIGEKEEEEIRNIYSLCRAPLLFISAKTGEGLSELKEHLRGKVSVFSGVSGAGKSSVISALLEKSDIITGAISEKSRRGKNTTRHSELIPMNPLEGGGFICDTPGFSALKLYEIPSGQLWRYYPEFIPYSDCRFTSCLHENEPGCNVKKAVEEGLINKIRYDNYLKLRIEAIKNDKVYHQ